MKKKISVLESEDQVDQEVKDKNEEMMHIKLPFPA